MVVCWGLARLEALLPRVYAFVSGEIANNSNDSELESDSRCTSEPADSCSDVHFERCADAWKMLQGPHFETNVRYIL